MSGHVLQDGEEIALWANGGDWIATWYPPDDEPSGQAHGATGICIATDGLVLISPDGERWGFPGGRTEAGETWRDTLDREMLEEACATVVDARLLGFMWAECRTGHEKGLVLVRSTWRAEVELADWLPQFEVPHRRVVPISDLAAHLWMEEGFEPIYRRQLHEAGLPYPGSELAS